MSTKTTAKQSNGSKIASKKTIANKTGKITGVTNQEILELDEPVIDTPNNEIVNGEIAEATGKANEKVATESKVPAKKAGAKKAVAVKTAAKKTVTTSKAAATNDKKIKLAATSYHYFRNWLKDFLRSHGVPSARFQKAPESYSGHITVLENEKANGLKALETWNKENPETKEMVYDIKK